MKNSNPKFRTTNLDLACVLVSEGFVCSMKKIGPVSSIFEFRKDPKVEATLMAFFKGECEVNITSFMYARFALKRELNMKSVEWEKARPGKVVLNPGQFYYYISEEGKPYKNMFANREPHIARVMNGNAFLTMNEAQVVAANTKID